MPKENNGGFFGNVALLDIASMHPSSIEDMNMFGAYTKRFSDIKQARIYVKHGELDKARTMLDGELASVIDDPDISNDDLATALKIPINSVYGLTSAHFPNRFNDVASGPRNKNIDNKVAKRGALFMITLKHKVQKLGYTVVHIKTDSIKIADSDQFIIDYIMEFGKKYGYNFEFEEMYDKMCIVNKSTYIAHSIYGKHKNKDNGWTATGLEFQVPYIFNTLFAQNETDYNDLKEVKSATTNLYLDFNEKDESTHNYSFVGKVGAFIPVKTGSDGGLLMRQNKDLETYSFATGSKNYRWKEYSVLKESDSFDQIDWNYYNEMIETAKKDILKTNSEWSYDRLFNDDYISPSDSSNSLANKMKDIK